MKRLSWLLIAALLMAFPLAAGGLAENDAEIEAKEAEREYYAQALAEVMQFLVDAFDGPVEMDTLFDGALRGMLEALDDPHSVYMDADEVEDFFEGVDGKFGGIGASLELVDGYPMIIAVFPVTPASVAGLQPGDLIIAVDDESTERRLLSHTVSRIRGEAGTEVSLQIYRPSTDQTFNMVLVRAVIEVPTLEYRALDDHLAYVRIFRFSEATARDLEIVGSWIRSTRVGGVVLDLRGNPGGYLSTTLQVADMLTPPGPILKIANQSGYEETFHGDDPGWGIPLVVLIDGRTTSGAEIVAAAVQDSGAGTLIGYSRSFGKGSVQDMFWLNNDGAIKLTTAHFFSPEGHPIHGVGVLPDILLEPVPGLAIPEVEECGPGSPRSAVATVQLALQQLGYDPGIVDGLYGPRTTKAVIAFQQQEGVEGHGRMDAVTVSVMQEQLERLQDQVLQRGITHLRGQLGME